MFAEGMTPTQIGIAAAAWILSIGYHEAGHAYA
jgi:hypothetical protein